jgi:hypothetical protein
MFTSYWTFERVQCKYPPPWQHRAFGYNVQKFPSVENVVYEIQFITHNFNCMQLVCCLYILNVGTNLRQTHSHCIINWLHSFLFLELVLTSEQNPNSHKYDVDIWTKSWSALSPGLLLFIFNNSRQYYMLSFPSNKLTSDSLLLSAIDLHRPGPSDNA